MHMWWHLRRHPSARVAALTRFTDAFGIAVFLVTGPLLATEFGASPRMATVVIAVCPLICIVGNPLLGRLSDHVGRRYIVLVGIAINMLGYLLLGHAKHISDIFLARVVSGAGSSNASTTGAVFSDISTQNDRAHMMALRSASYGLGLLAGPLFGAFLFAFSASLAGYGVAVLLLFNLVYSLFALQETTQSKEDNTGYVGFGSSLTPIYVAASLVSCAFSIIFSVLPLVVMKYFVTTTEATLGRFIFPNAGAQAAGITAFVTLLASVVAIASQIQFAPAAISRMGEECIILISSLLWSFAFLLSALTQSTGLAFFAPSIVLSGLCYGLFYPAVSTLVSRKSNPAVQAFNLGKIDAVVAVGIGVGPLFSGMLFARSPVAPYCAAIVVLLVSAAIVRWTDVHTLSKTFLLETDTASQK